MVPRSPHPFSRVCAGQSPWSGFLRTVAVTTTVMYISTVGQQVCTCKLEGHFHFPLLCSLHSREETPKTGCFPRWPCRYMAMKFASLPFLCTSEHANRRASLGACSAWEGVVHPHKISLEMETFPHELQGGHLS